MLTSLAGVLTGIWLILQSQHSTTTTLTLLFGIIVAVLCLVDLVRGAGPVFLHR